MKAKKTAFESHINLLGKLSVVPLGHSACVKKKSACFMKKQTNMLFTDHTNMFRVYSIKEYNKKVCGKSVQDLNL